MRKTKAKVNKKQAEKNIRTGEKAITLIALIVTIIVLLILAGVSIATLTGENGILTRANNAKYENGKANLIEKVKVDLIGEQATNESTIVNSAMLKKVLDKYFIDVPEINQITTEWIQIAELTSNEENGGYKIKISDIYNGKIQKEKILAKEVLVPNSNGETAEKKSPYVRYEELECRVLYNDNEHGLQIITNDNIDNVTLGDENFEKTILSYNNAVDILNNKAKEYKGNKAIDARSLGSIATLIDGKFQGDISEMKNIPIAGSIKEQDINYREDNNQIRALDLKPTDNTWLASRCIYKEDDRYYFGVYKYILNSNSATSDADGDWVIYADNGETNCEARTCGLRAILLLPSDIYIIDGDGTKDNPYIIEQ